MCGGVISPAQFDPPTPARVATPDFRVSTSKLAHFGKLRFQLPFAPHIMEGGSKGSSVCKLTEVAIAEPREVEPLDLEDHAAEHLSTAIMILNALRGVLSMS